MSRPARNGFFSSRLGRSRLTQVVEEKVVQRKRFGKRGTDIFDLDAMFEEHEQLEAGGWRAILDPGPQDPYRLTLTRIEEE